VRLRLLVIDTDPEHLALVRDVFADHEVVVSTGRDAMDIAVRLVPHAVIIELGLAEASAIDIAESLRERHGALVYLAAVTARREVAVSDAFDYVAHKPATVSMLREIEVNVLARRLGTTT
jgi:DNA-binding response OmpR family regulator